MARSGSSPKARIVFFSKTHGYEVGRVVFFDRTVDSDHDIVFLGCLGVSISPVPWVQGIDSSSRLVVYCKVVFDAAAWDAGSPVPLGIATASITLGYVVSIIVLEHILAFAVCRICLTDSAHHSHYDLIIQTPSRVWVEALATLTAGGLFVATLILLVAPDPPMDCPPCVFGRGPSGSETSLNQITGKIILHTFLCHSIGAAAHISFDLSDGVTSPRTLFPAIFPIIQALSGSLGAVNLFWLFALLVSARMAARRGQTRVWQMPVAECFEKSQAPHDEEGNPTPPPAYSPRSDHPFESRTGGRHGRARHSRMATHPAGNMQAAQNTILRHERIIDRGMGMGDTMGGI